MRKWIKGIEINAPIEQVWKLLDGSLEDMQKIMPEVMENEPVKVTEEVIGSVHRQKYKEGKRIMEYDVEVLEYENGIEKKKLKIEFVLADMFRITALYEVLKLEENKTFLRYTVTNTPLKWYVQLFLLFSTEKTVNKFLERVKDVAEAESNKEEKNPLSPLE
ncbi:SRPBCC family protein [Jeotgalibacillus sp. S-D1]|uniref:SRPBCC family protein n=1 Tax=Jeotgalibacillus sp. S-D1 TaxID=2552189 RepID=UPI0010594409|nr:SRPBCC family protein [Jeotgalibacillus sp. S-D1]TDL31355.1 SRPBCC family protein [Jeotgalibacillus sp. S-D1]